MSCASCAGLGASFEVEGGGKRRHSCVSDAFHLLSVVSWCLPGESGYEGPHNIGMEIGLCLAAWCSFAATNQSTKLPLQHGGWCTVVSNSRADFWLWLSSCRLRVSGQHRDLLSVSAANPGHNFFLVQTPRAIENPSPVKHAPMQARSSALHAYGSTLPH